MKKFFIVAWLIVAAFISQTTPAFAAYSDDQIISTLHTRIARMENSTSEFSTWKHRKSDWSFCKANDCYLSTNGMVYSIFIKSGVNALIVITQVDLNSNSYRFIEGYVYNAVNYTVNKLPESKVSKQWRTESISTEYCKYLREHYNEIQGA